MRITTWSGAALLLASAGIIGLGCATSGDKLPSFKESTTETVTATVTAIDQSTRAVTLKGERGEEVSFVAGPAVQNLAQVQVGDQVKVEYVQSIAVDVRRNDGTQPDLVVTGAAGTAKPGEKPAGAIGGEITASASIQAIDRANLRVTVLGPSGNLRVLQVKDPKKLENVKVGDMIYLTYTEALAISLVKVTPAGAAPAK